MKYKDLVYDQNVRQWSFFSDLTTLHPKIFPVKIDVTLKEFFFCGGRIGCITFGSVTKEDVPKVVERIGKTVKDISK